MTDADHLLFGPEALPGLRGAAADLAWLLERGYPPGAALTLVGDRFALAARPRKALMRGVCAPAVARRRRQERRPLDADTPLAVDGFNVLVAVESALKGALLVRGTDGLLRDLASMHGRYRSTEQTHRAIGLLTAALRPVPPAQVRWILDRPVSHSGRVAELLREAGFADVVLTDLADRALAESGRPVASADGPLLDRAGSGCDLVGAVVADLPDAWVIDLAQPADFFISTPVACSS